MDLDWYESGAILIGGLIALGFIQAASGGKIVDHVNWSCGVATTWLTLYKGSVCVYDGLVKDDYIYPLHDSYCLQSRANGLACTMCRMGCFNPEDAKPCASSISERLLVATASLASSNRIERIPIDKSDMVVANQIFSEPWLRLRGKGLNRGDVTEFYAVSAGGTVWTVKPDEVLSVGESTFEVESLNSAN